MDHAMDLLKADIGKAINGCLTALPWLVDVDEARRDVIYEMAFQLGVHGVLGFKQMLMHLKEGDYADAAREMLESLWHKQTPSRCEELANIMIGAV
jgi:lysozyme